MSSTMIIIYYGCEWAKRFSPKKKQNKLAKEFSLMRVWVKCEGEAENPFAVLSFAEILFAEWTPHLGKANMSRKKN